MGNTKFSKRERERERDFGRMVAGVVKLSLRSERYLKGDNLQVASVLQIQTFLTIVVLSRTNVSLTSRHRDDRKFLIVAKTNK